MSWNCFNWIMKKNYFENNPACLIADFYKSLSFLFINLGIMLFLVFAHSIYELLILKILFIFCHKRLCFLSSKQKFFFSLNSKFKIKKLEISAWSFAIQDNWVHNLQLNLFWKKNINNAGNSRFWFFWILFGFFIRKT